MRSSIWGSIPFLAIIVVAMPSCMNNDDDGSEEDSDEFDDGIIEDGLINNRTLEGPTIHAIFALYGNLPKKKNGDDSKYRAVDHLPGPLREDNTAARFAWGVVNTLGGGFDVWHVGPNEWWNGVNLPTPRWIYDDASRHHDKRRENARIRELSQNHNNEPGFIYMAYTGKFKSLGTIYRPKRTTYFYEIYKDNESWPAYLDWKQRASRNKVPMFNISILHDFKGDKDPAHCGHTVQPSWEATKEQIRRSVIDHPFYDGNTSRIKIGFFADEDCFIDHEDAQYLADFLNEIQYTLTPH